jgi:hypothetical protein
MKHLFIFFLFVLLLSSCTSHRLGSVVGARSMSRLSQAAIVEFLRYDYPDKINLHGKGLPKIDPMLCVRDSVSFNDSLFFTPL